MTVSDKELEKKLIEAGKKLLDPPSSVEELLLLLNEDECYLSQVHQLPPDPMKHALSPSMNALIANKLFKHSDVDVRVAVAACISEITRITAPDAPYDDEQMKEVFELIVSSFENLNDVSSRSYAKRILILDMVAKVRSCVVMLDLECDTLIIKMFNHFLKAIERDHHAENVLASMKIIMTLVLEEYEDISPELISPLLRFVLKDNEVPQASQKLAEQVLKNSAAKLKPYLTNALRSSALLSYRYSSVVALICGDASGVLKQNESIADEKDKPRVEKVVTAKLADALKDGSLRSEFSNGVVQIVENDDSLADTDSPKKQDDANMKETGEGHKQEQRNKTPFDSKDGCRREPTSPPHDSSTDAALSSDEEKETDAQAFPTKRLPNENANVAFPSQTESLLPDAICLKEPLHKKKKESLSKEVKSSIDGSGEVALEEPTSLEAKQSKRSREKVTSLSMIIKKSAFEAKPAKQSVKKTIDIDNEKKKRSGKAIEKEQSHSDNNEKPSIDEEQLVEKTPKTNAKRKHNLGKRKATDDKEYGYNLVGTRVKVWWPVDRVFYEGVVYSYDETKKKHLVIYADGDREVLNLTKEKWDFIEDNNSINEKFVSMGTESGKPEEEEGEIGTFESFKGLLSHQG